MPSRNRIKSYIPDSYYHAYNRGVNKQDIFLDAEDYSVFLNLLKRYLSEAPHADRKSRVYVSLYDKMEILAFCLMPNHFHLLIYQVEPTATTDLLQRVSTSYTMYFNKKYIRTGPLFQERFKASIITRDDYLMHISRYIHLNPKDYENWEFSSIAYYKGEKSATWIRPSRILSLSITRADYMSFLKDYEGHKKVLDEIKFELANDSEI